MSSGVHNENDQANKVVNGLISEGNGEGGNNPLAAEMATNSANPEICIISPVNKLSENSSKEQELSPTPELVDNKDDEPWLEDVKVRN